ncbi:MAG TPA: LysM peptidoglycan-binding domain-containing protein [Burkholderiales bacterium]|nr:LysM peptidoglycan-binding domain-containing protein [Burkholderiales bacterium]
MLSTAFLSMSRASELPGYDFHYSAAGDGMIKPVQIFDDGTHLYLQFRDPDMIPAVFVDTVNGVVRLPVHQEFPYIVADSLSPELLIKFGELQAVVRYDGGRSLTDNGSMTGSSEPLATASAASIPREQQVASATPFMRSESPEPFSGELIFNHTPAEIKSETKTEVHSTDPVRILPVNSITSLSSRIALTKSNIHIVSPGESLSIIAQKYHTSAHQIAIANNLSNADLIYAGQKLLLPAGLKGKPKIIETGAVLSVQPALRIGRHNIRVNRLPQFRLYEKQKGGEVVVKKISSLAEIRTRAELSHAIYLRGTEAAIDARRAALTRSGIDPAKIHVIKRQYDAEPDDGIVDIVFTNKD